MKILKPKFIVDWGEIRKEGGFFNLLKKKGTKVLVAFILFYLIRDSILYILIPIMIAKGFITCM
jgi:hypothetical protein